MSRVNLGKRKQNIVHLSSILFLAPFRKKHLAFIKMLIWTLSNKKEKRTPLHFIISLNFLRLTTFQTAFIFEKISTYWVALLLEHENSALFTCLQFFSSPPWGKKHLKDTDTTVIHISSFQELIDINNFLVLELLTNGDNVLCSINRWDLKKLKFSREEAVRQWEVFEFNWDSW